MKKEFELVGVEVIKGLKKTEFKTGSYHSSSPSGAAKKAFLHFCKLNQLGEKRVCESTVTVGDQTNDRHHSYKMKRVYDPKTAVIAGKEVVYKYRIDSEKIKK
jgi:hypothetical protein